MSYQNEIANPGAEREITQLKAAAERLLDHLMNDHAQQAQMHAYINDVFKRYGFNAEDGPSEYYEHTPLAALYWATAAEWHAKVLAQAILSMSN